MIAIDAGETHGSVWLWICYSWHVHTQKILSKDPKMQRYKALSFLISFFPTESKMADIFSFPSSFRQRQNISRKGFCLCTLVPNLWAQLYFKRNKQYISKWSVKRAEQDSVSLGWVSGSHLLHIQVLWVREPRAVPGGSSCLPSQFSFGLGLGRMRDVRKPCRLAQNLPWSAYSDGKNSMAKRRWDTVGKSLGGSGFEVQ